MRSPLGLLLSLSLCVAACGGSASSTAPPATLTITLANNGVPLPPGTSVQATATINGSPATNVTWSTSNSSVATVSPSGMVTGVSKGTSEIRATSGNSNGTIVVAVLAQAVAVHIFSGNNQGANAGSPLADPLCTYVTDAQGNQIIGMPVTYTVMSGGGHIAAPTSPSTGSNGIAVSGTWTLGAAQGAQTVEASVPGATSATFTATAH